MVVALTVGEVLDSVFDFVLGLRYEKARASRASNTAHASRKSGSNGRTCCCCCGCLEGAKLDDDVVILSSHSITCSTSFISSGDDNFIIERGLG